MNRDCVAIVTGGSSGIGKSACAFLRARGCRVYEFSRRGVDTPEAIHKTVDVTDEQAVLAAVEDILRQEGNIDILVNCAGFGISGAVEFTELRDAKRQLDVNFFGVVNTVKAVLPSMRQTGRGRIVNVSSVAAPVPIPFQTFYSASKAAINAYTMALANEVRPYGVTVTAVQPGDIATGFTGAREKSPAGDEQYGGRISRSVSKMEKDEQNGMDVAAAGRYVAKIALKKRVKPLYTIGFSYQCVTLLCQLLPCGLRNRIIFRLYAH